MAASRYHSIMTRLLLTWIGVAAFQLGMPRAVAAVELLRPVGEPTSVDVRLEAQSRGVLTRDGYRIDVVRAFHVTPGPPAEPPHLLRASANGAAPIEARRCLGPISPARVLPDARAPPA